MATTPTDDPLANSDRTVGVHAYMVHDTHALKREALLFDQIAIPGLDLNVINGPGDLCWLQGIGIVRGTVPLPPGSFQDVVCVSMRDIRDGHASLVAGPFVVYIGEPRVFTPVPESGFDNIVVWDQEAALSRRYSIDLRRQGINAFPILETRRQIGSVFPSGTSPDTTPILEVILKSMPIPDDQTPWEDIIEFRNDPDSTKRLRRLRVWVRKFAKDTTATSLAEMKEEIEVLLDEYEEHMKLHRMKVNKGATETLLTLAGKVAEDFVKLKWGELAKLPFILRERKISLLEAELNAPHQELAFISMARERFSR